jgi:hypothetical protein
METSARFGPIVRGLLESLAYWEKRLERASGAHTKDYPTKEEDNHV